MTRHIVIPDCQVKPGVDFRYLTATGKYIAEKKPDLYPDKDRFLFYRKRLTDNLNSV